MADIRGRIGLDASAWERGIGKVRQSLGPLAGAMGAAFSVGAVVSFGRSIVRMGSEISDMAVRTQLSTNSWQAWENIVKDAGYKSEDAATAIGQLNAAQEEAARGSQKQLDAFLALGLSMDEITGSTETMLEAVARGFVETGNYGALVDLMGREKAPKMQEALERLGVEGFGNLTTDMQAAGRVMDEDFIDALDAADDTMSAFFSQMKIRVAEGIRDLQTLGQTAWAAVKAAFSGDDGGIDWKKVAGQLFLPLQAMEDFRPDYTGAIEAAGDKLAEIDAEEDKRAEDRAKKRADREERDQNRLRKIFDASQRGEDGSDPAKPDAAARAGRVTSDRIRFDDQRRMGANIAGRIGAGDTGKKQVDLLGQIAKASERMGDLQEELVRNLDGTSRF